MSKINATYSSGYYIAPDVDFRKLEEQQRQERRGKRRQPGADDAADDDNVKRQTFAMPFDLICLHCNRRIARGSHVYTNRRATNERYLDSIRIWELEMLCRFCKEKYYLRTDPETPKDTGGYICLKGCKRVEGDFYDLNKQNQEAREEWKKAKAEAELDPLAALEKENEAARQLEERNRQIEEEVEQQAEHDDRDLLTMLRSRPRRHATLGDANSSHHSDDVSDGDGDPDTPSAPAKPPISSTGLPPAPTSNLINADKDGTGEFGGAEDVDNDDAGEDADERSYREFEEDMDRRWRALERDQRAQRRREQESVSAKSTVQESEVDRVLARYGGVRHAPPSTAENGTLAGTAPALSTEISGLTVKDDSRVAEGSAFTASAVPSVRRNKFLVAVEEGDDGPDAAWRAPMTRPATAVVAPVSTVATAATHGVSSQSRVGGSALLRNLVDSDSDDDDGDADAST
ncbi:hypothetical protein ABB37_04703 [Leptomonas pyrrhocoris]|uniref:Splicing factor YJU2 n=1 Tax=Leptomonas pyrrhocoris TaxID=157538 RepID=A0A0N0DVK1_LEPPY|nr:hypothetical protein ABB37_04703 [Leptomonas pyrrhocoris]XP_015658924.1 hypothetical protein ABB37_04703 [Leptomonas pyrrhocoris]KPA80484.1 hypothetical protein ABB37_04703 [Leptomonas pyrrhocoris]KPA80485.1 hypothetical protein ABB37_04703 [Leptomonas pyrrhocoris]|eukprot:XP_015658923.1 hypothetical protein ABB37_04703 [Leptomonas pyrrhocoris]